jgi:hypothetical protein
MTSRRIRELLVSLLVFLMVYAIYLNSGNAIPLDSMWTIPTSMSLLKQGNANLDEYQPLIDRTEEGSYLIQKMDGHLYANYPPSIALLIAPVVFVAEQVARLAYSVDLAAYVQNVVPHMLELLIASLFAALTVLLLFRLAREFLSMLPALALTLIFAFGTAAWSVASRALWRNGISLFLLTVALYLIVLARNKPRLIQFVSLPLAFSFTVRGTNGLSIALITLYVLLQYRSYFWRYLLWALPVAVPFALYNLALYQAVASPYYSVYQPFSASHPNLIEGALGNLISPSRGLLIYSPVLILAAAGVIVKLKQHTFEKLDGTLIAIIVLHWLVISDFALWWGGWAYGPRFFADVLPYFFYLAIPAIVALTQLSGPRKWVLVAGVSVLAGFSCFVHYRGANAKEVMNEWHTWPTDLGNSSARLWDWRDPQFLRGLKWGTPTELSVAGVPVRQYALETYQLLGTNDIHSRKFNADTAVIAPPGQAWVAIADDQPIGTELAPLFEGIAPQAQLRSLGSNVPYRLYHFDLGSIMQQAAHQAEQRAWYSSDLAPEATLAQPIDLPVSFGSVINLVGVKTITDSQTSDVTLITYWQVNDPPSATLRLFVHALDINGQIAAQDDRQDTSAKDWRPGDLIAQVNRLSLPADAGPVWIEAGWYDPDSGERLPLLLDGQPADQRILLTHIENKQQ